MQFHFAAIFSVWFFILSLYIQYANAANERTLICLKPDAPHRKLIGRIIQRFEDKGLKLVGLKLVRASRELVEEHYMQHVNRTFYPELIGFMLAGPVVPMVWEGLNAVQIVRNMLGKTEPESSYPGTIRGDFCLNVDYNIIHGSHSVKAAKREISLWFRTNELIQWKSGNIEMGLS